MDKDTLFRLIKKIITGTASKTEEEQVDKTFFDPFFSAGWSEEEMGNKKEIQTRLLNRIKGEQTRRVKERKLIVQLGKVAAVLVLFLMIGFYGYQNSSKGKQLLSMFSVQKLSPGKEIASLELNDGRILNLEELQLGEVIENTDFSLVKTAEGNLEYHHHQITESSSTEQWNTLRTPKGGKFQIVLADGTKAWLNAESTLAFPKNFMGSTRRVKATGEVYFEVSPDKNKPFIVNTKEMDIQVLGTSFNVSTYEDGAYPKVSLIEGAVQVKTVSSVSKLIPGQRASIQSNQIHIGEFDVESEIAWKNDYFIFKNKNIKEIMRDLARWYDAEIEYQGEDWGEKNYTIRISRRKNIEEILSIIELTESVKFKIQGRRIIVLT